AASGATPRGSASPRLRAAVATMMSERASHASVRIGPLRVTVLRSGLLRPEQSFSAGQRLRPRERRVLDEAETVKGHGQQLKHRGGYESPRNPLIGGAADRIRTGDVQLGKLAFCH